MFFHVAYLMQSSHGSDKKFVSPKLSLRIQVCHKKGITYPYIPISRMGLETPNPIRSGRGSGFLGCEILWKTSEFLHALGCAGWAPDPVIIKVIT